MTRSEMPWIPAAEVFERVSMLEAVRAVQRHLRSGADPADDFDRSVLPVSHGQVLIMPSHTPEFFGIKVASVAPDNPQRGKERIQGVYLLMDAETLTPSALIDGAALTALRTPAVSAAAADLLAPAVVDHMVVFGSGPQAVGHVAAMRAIRSIPRVTIVARNGERAETFAADLRSQGSDARTGTSSDVQHAQLIVCATTSRDPLFEGDLVPSDSCTVAVGSHEPDARELDATLLGRAQVVVEDTATALREAGDVMIPVAAGSLDPAALVPLREIVTGTCAVDTRRPRVFKSTGMAWEDLVVAAELYRTVRAQD